jgi:DnaK suppressor protein
MWMTREEIAAALGIVPNSVRGKVQKGQIERKVENGKNLYRVADSAKSLLTPEVTPAPQPRRPVVVMAEPADVEIEPEETDYSERSSSGFDPKKILMEQRASLRLDRNIDAIEKGDEIDLATNEISRELDAKISMRQHRQLQEIEDALERIKHGEYGICEECGEPVPEQRLRLFPAARHCVRCQEELDHMEKLKEVQGMRGGAFRDEPAESTFSRSFED